MDARVVAGRSSAARSRSSRADGSADDVDQVRGVSHLRIHRTAAPEGCTTRPVARAGKTLNADRARTASGAVAILDGRERWAFRQAPLTSVRATGKQCSGKTQRGDGSRSLAHAVIVAERARRQKRGPRFQAKATALDGYIRGVSTASSTASHCQRHPELARCIVACSACSREGAAKSRIGSHSSLIAPLLVRTPVHA